MLHDGSYQGFHDMVGHTKDCGTWWDMPRITGHGGTYWGLQDMVGHTRDCRTWWDKPGIVGHGTYQGLQDMVDIPGIVGLDLTYQGLNDMVGHSLTYQDLRCLHGFAGLMWLNGAKQC